MVQSFRLQQVLNYRKGKEDEAREELAQKEASLKKAQQRLDLFRQEKQELENLRRQQESYTVDLSFLNLTLQYHQRVEENMEQQEKKCRKLEGQTDHRRKQLKKCWQKRRVMEILKDQYRERLVWEEKKREFKINDELALNRYSRKGGEQEDE